MPSKGSESVGGFVRTTHPYGFRSGQWGQIVGIVGDDRERACCLVVFPDGATDRWVIDDPQEPYEFASEAPR